MGLFDFLKSKVASDQADKAGIEMVHPALGLVVEECRVSESDAVLQVGFGDAELLRRLIPHLPKGRVAGIARSTAQIESAITEFGYAVRQFKAEFREGVVSKIPFLDGEFSKVVSVDQTQYWLNVETAFRELARVLAPGGELILLWSSGLNGRNVVGRSQPALSPDETKVMLAQAGLNVIRQRETHDDKLKYFLVVASKI